jgi:hypothetical protein
MKSKAEKPIPFAVMQRVNELIAEKEHLIEELRKGLRSAEDGIEIVREEKDKEIAELKAKKIWEIGKIQCPSCEGYFAFLCNGKCEGCNEIARLMSEKAEHRIPFAREKEGDKSHLQAQNRSSNPKILIACEFSGIVREAFKNKGWDAWSCDLLPSETEGQHIQGDVLEHLNDGWDMMIAFPPCTHLAVSGARWFKDKEKEQQEAVNFFMKLANAPIEKIAIENPIGIMSKRYRKPDQIIQPWQFGHGEVKATCLWLKNLPNLKQTNVVEGRTARVHREPPGVNRWKNRSRTYQGIADAMAEQWGIGERKGVIPFKDTPFGSDLIKAVTERRDSELRSVGYADDLNWVLELLKGGKR